MLIISHEVLNTFRKVKTSGCVSLADPHSPVADGDLGLAAPAQHPERGLDCTASLGKDQNSNSRSSFN